MNYDPNTIQWRRGDVVIHDIDAKEPRMLMRVIGYNSAGECETEYILKDNRRKATYHNPVAYLHSPSRFGIIVQDGSEHAARSAQLDWDRMRYWNRKHKIGAAVLTTSADGGFEAVTTSEAFIGLSGGVYIMLKPGGMWALDHLKPLPEHTGSE